MTVGAREVTRRFLAATGGLPPQVQESEGPAPKGEPSGGLQRQIPKGFTYDPRALKPLARMLLSLSVSLGHSLTAYRHFTRLKSSTVSPDGRVGGRGYVMDVREVRARLQQACELLSDVSDTIHDEINAPHWKPKLSDLGANDAEDLAALLEQSREILDDPEGFGEEGARKIEERNDGPNGTPNDASAKKSPSTPGAGDPEVQDHDGPEAMKVKQAKTLAANSSLPVSTLPGGPRVDHIGPAEGRGPFGSYNDDEPLTDDDWGREEGVGLTEPLGIQAASGTPTDTTPSDANDFGLGFGEGRPATEGYGELSSDGKGVWGPASGLPGSSGEGGWGEESLARDVTHKTFPTVAASELPGDGDDLVARRDEYEGFKGNQLDVRLAASALPGKDPGVKETYDIDLPNTSEGEVDPSHPVRVWGQPVNRNAPLYTYDRTSNV